MGTLGVDMPGSFSAWGGQQGEIRTDWVNPAGKQSTTPHVRREAAWHRRKSDAREEHAWEDFTKRNLFTIFNDPKLHAVMIDRRRQYTHRSLFKSLSSCGNANVKVHTEDVVAKPYAPSRTRQHSSR